MFFHPVEGITGSFTTSIESKALSVNSNQTIIELNTQSFVYVITKLRFSFVDGITNIEKTLITLKRQNQELPIIERGKLGSIGSKLLSPEPLLDLFYNTKQTFIEIDSTQKLLVEAISPVALSPGDITLTAFGYKLNKSFKTSK